MHRRWSGGKRILVSLLSAAMIMSSLELSAFSVSATQLEAEVAESEGEAVEETEDIAGTEEAVETEEAAETEETTEMEEVVETEEVDEITGGTEEEAVMETEIQMKPDETVAEVEDGFREAEVQEESEDEDYGQLLESWECGATYIDENGNTQTYDVIGTVYDSGTDEDDTVATGDLLVISGNGKMADYINNSPAPWKESYSSGLKQVKVNNGVTSVGDSAFYSCSSLESVKLPESVLNIGSSAFKNCSSLNSIELPEGVTSIGNYTFQGCKSLGSIEMSEDVTSIGMSAFSGCSSLSSIKLPAGVTSIGSYAFYECSSLNSIVLPESLKRIENDTFRECSSLKSIELPKDLTSIGSYAFGKCSSLESINLSSDLTSIEDSTFFGCSSLSSIEIPKGVTSIGRYAFYGCSSIKSIELPEVLTNIGNSAFSGCDSLECINMPASVVSVGNTLFLGTSQEIQIYTEASSWYNAFIDKAWGNSKVNLIKPYSISYFIGEEQVVVAEVYADGRQSYTFEEGDLPENAMWCKEGYDKDENVSFVIAGTTMENIAEDIVLVQAEMDGFWVADIGEQTYTGKALKPEPRVYDCNTGKLLKKGTDYTVAYQNNIKAYTLTVKDRGFEYGKAPCIVIKGKGDYSECLNVYFTIQPKDIGEQDVTANDILVEYNGKLQTKVPVITYNKKKLSGTVKPATGQNLKTTKDFVYSYPALDDEDTKAGAYLEPGTYKILVEGTGNFIGSRVVTLIVINKGTDISKVTINKISAQNYTGKEITLDEKQMVVTAKINGKKVTLTKDTDYTVSYQNNINVGTATVIITGKGAYTGTKTATFKINGTSLAKVQISGLENKVYNGKAQTQELTLKLNCKTVSGNENVTVGITLTEGKDYSVTYDKNVNVGTAKVTITGKGGYTGTIKKTFKITAYDLSGETDAEGNVKENSPLIEANGFLMKKDGELSMKYMKGGCQPEVQLSFNGAELTVGKDYTVTYSNNKKVFNLKPGDEGYNEKKAPTITVKGKGNFKGSFKKTFTITEKDLEDSDFPVTITAIDKAATMKKGGYISKPILTDQDGTILKAGTDYEEPVYAKIVKDETTGDETTEPLNEKDIVEAGTEVKITVQGKGAYTGELTTYYRITAKNFGAVKVQSIQKDYTGREVTLNEKDFYAADGTNKGTSKVTFGNGKNKVALEYGKDFEIVEGSYKSNIKKGTASVTLRGKGEYGGIKTIKFKIGARGLFWWLFK